MPPYKLNVLCTTPYILNSQPTKIIRTISILNTPKINPHESLKYRVDVKSNRSIYSIQCLMESFSFIQPHLDYCTSMYYLYASSYYIKSKSQLIQNFTK